MCDRWLYLKYASIIDNILDLGPNATFTSGSVKDESRGHALAELQSKGSVTCTGRENKTNVKIYILSTHQYTIMRKIQEQFKDAND